MESLYFIAIVPPVEIEKEIRDIKEYISKKYDTKASLRSPSHITLHIPFKWKDEEELFLKNLLMDFFKTKSSFQIVLNGFGAFTPRVIFIKVEENRKLAEIHHQLNDFCQSRQLIKKAKSNDPRFHPHVTIAFRDLRKENFFPAFEELKDIPFSASFTTTDITLLKHMGTEWNCIQHFPLNV